MVDVCGRTLLYLVSFVGLFFFFFLVEGIAAHLSAGLKEPVEWETDDTGEDGARSCAHAEGQP